MRKILLLLLLLSACLPPTGGLPPSGNISQPVHPWASALRALDPANAPTPSNDITAVYLRPNGDVLQIRVDLLDFDDLYELSVDIQIGDDSTPQATPFNIHIPSESLPARISLDSRLAIAIVDVPLSEIPSRPRVDVSTPEDEVTGLTLGGPVPIQTAPVLLTFYDTFAARFPAEALRSWDGAHSGPRGERHGLKHLLDAAEEYQVPIALLDLKDPASPSALDAMDVLPQIRRMQEGNLLILPQISTDETLFDLPLSLYWFVPYPSLQLDSKYRFQFTADTSHLHRWFELPAGMITSIPIASETEATQPTANGSSLEIRRALLETALNVDKKDLLVLGGSLQETTWGSPDIVGTTLAYFASRPYIRLQTQEDLVNFPTKFGKPELLTLPLDKRADKLEVLYQNLTQPVLDFAENWNGSPLSSCDTDLDQDHQNECILANKNILAIFDPQGARLTYFFSEARIGNSRDLHQLIGPSWQVAVGLSNPSLWDLSAGEAADPGAYPGAFADADDPFKPYKPVVEENTLVFTSQDGMRIKTFNLTETGLAVEYQTQEPVLTQIPLLVDPEARFNPGWAGKYVQENTPGGLTWGLKNGLMVRIQAEGLVEMRAFNETLSLLASPEDPDFDYPPGHYIPFPMAIVEVEMQDGYFLRLERLP